MPPALCSTELALLQPTQDELEAAKKVLKNADSKDMRSKMHGMANWLKENGGANPEAAASRGDARKGWLESYLVHQLRNKANVKIACNSRDLTSDKQKFQDEEHLCQKEMDTRFGEEKSAAMRAKLNELKMWRPCQVMGKTDMHMRELTFTKDWKRLLEL